MLKKIKVLYFIAPTAFLFGTLSSYLIFGTDYLHLKSKIASSGQIREKDDSDLIEPLLLCSESSLSYQENSLYKKVSSYINEEIHAGKALDISFYYRDLNSGKWTGVNESDTYAPASLLKVPTMISILKVAENRPNLLSKEIAYHGEYDEVNKGEYFQPGKQILANKNYTVYELLSYMIRYSDNRATELLLDTFGEKNISKVHLDLQLAMPPQSATSGTVDYMSVRDYARLFRVLYNATYLNREYSLKALNLLIDPDFPEGIAAGVDPAIKVANKFGERTVNNVDGTIDHRELHDCGIVYRAHDPYLLCIMTKGQDFEALTAIIKEISAISYREDSSKW